MLERDNLREVARLTGRQEDWQIYRKARNTCMKQVNKSKEKHYKDLYDNIEREGDTKKLYKLTGELLDIITGNLPQRFLVDGKLVSKPQEMANLQLDYYNQKI